MTVLKWILRILGGLLILLILYIGLKFTPSLWRHFVVYPGLDSELTRLEEQRKTPDKPAGLNYYKGILHAHTWWSHDSRGSLEGFLPPAKELGVDFIFFSDHRHAELDTFPRSYKGIYDGVIIEPGTENRGLLVWPLIDTVVDWNQETNTVIKQVIADGGLIFYAHTEEPHDWDNPDYQGMEIYNVHTDSKDEDLYSHIVNFIINGNSYRRWAYREMFDEQTEILTRWDQLNQTRQIVGISAADAHDNQNLRARYLDDGRVEWIGINAKAIDTTEVGLFEKIMLSEPDPAGYVFNWSIDTYYESFRTCMNYVLADTLTTAALANGLRRGHLFIAFSGLGDATGFMYSADAVDGSRVAMMGDSVALDAVSRLSAVSPLPARFRLIRNGEVAETVENVYRFESKNPLSPGVYRVEAAVTLDDEWAPWIYSNPIYIY